MNHIDFFDKYDDEYENIYVPDEKEEEIKKTYKKKVAYNLYGRDIKNLVFGHTIQINYMESDRFLDDSTYNLVVYYKDNYDVEYLEYLEDLEPDESILLFHFDELFDFMMGIKYKNNSMVASEIAGIEFEDYESDEDDEDDEDEEYDDRLFSDEDEDENEEVEDIKEVFIDKKLLTPAAA